MPPPYNSNRRRAEQWPRAGRRVEKTFTSTNAGYAITSIKARLRDSPNSLRVAARTNKA
jgi:hypothetical protein